MPEYLKECVEGNGVDEKRILKVLLPSAETVLLPTQLPISGYRGHIQGIKRWEF